jgi:hypothetical protein
MTDRFYFHRQLCLIGPEYMNSELTRNLTKGFTFGECELHFLPSPDGSIAFAISDTMENAASLLSVADSLTIGGNEYALSVTERGAVVCGSDKHGLLCGFFHLLLQIQSEEHGFSILCQTAKDTFCVKRRMIHYCIFYETDLLFIKKMCRLAGILGYTHVVLEFWGMLKLNAHPALAWENAFDKETVKELLREIREVGMEPIPMFNHLGHASACRISAGKHVVLDRYPALHRLFTPDGWVWRPDSEEVDLLHQSIRRELYELFGDTEYFHAGLDEAYCMARDPRLLAMQPDILHRITHEIASEGKRPMIWADMLLPPESGTYRKWVKDQTASRKLLSALHPSTVLVDWDYDIKTSPVSTAVYAKNEGFDTIGAPWYGRANIASYVRTASEHDLFGVMITTWHTLCRHTPAILTGARDMGSPLGHFSHATGADSETATLLRALSFEGANSYADAGWARGEILNTMGTHD